jgi:hypothetical protein
MLRLLCVTQRLRPAAQRYPTRPRQWRFELFREDIEC